MRRQRKVYKYKDDELEKIYDSTYKASKDLGISRALLYKYCNNEVKRKKIDLRWDKI